MTRTDYRYTPKYRPMDAYAMKAYAPEIEWEYVEAAQIWPNSPLPRSSFKFGVFQTSKALTAEQIENLEVRYA